MALSIDSAYLPDSIEVARTIPVAGVTTNPTLLLQAQERGQDLNRGHNIFSCQNPRQTRREERLRLSRLQDSCEPLKWV
jgi:transaldolase